MAVKTRKHYGESTFVETSRTQWGDGTITRHGYCRECKADMTIFPKRSGGGGIGIPSGLRHYNSHGTAIRLGLWGSRR